MSVVDHWEEDKYELLDDAGELFLQVLKMAAGNFDYSSDHMQETPHRFVMMLHELTTPEPFKFTTFESNVDEMVAVTNIPFYTFCAHHVLPFHGVAHVAYLPQGKICGISKLARTVQFYSRGLNVQEDLTVSIADRIEDELDPLGVGVVMRAEHLCMTMRGAQVPGAKTSTSAMRGAFLDPNKQARGEFFEIIRSNHG
jgi:GTP cyclohydrolase I